MKQISSKTILKQGDKTYQPIEVDGVIYWVDNEKIIAENDFSINYRLSDNNPYINKASYHKEKKKEKGKIIAQSQLKLDGIPVVSLDSYVKGTINKMAYSEVTDIDNSQFERGFIYGFHKGFKSNPNQYTQADIEKAFRLGEDSKEDEINGDGALELSEILEQINSISVIEVDEQFNVISYGKD
jgi:hypothetical protein